MFRFHISREIDQFDTETNDFLHASAGLSMVENKNEFGLADDDDEEDEKQKRRMNVEMTKT